MKKYLLPVCLLVVRNEFVSLIALLIVGGMFLCDMFGWMEEGEY